MEIHNYILGILWAHGHIKSDKRLDIYKEDEFILKLLVEELPNTKKYKGYCICRDEEFIKYLLKNGFRNKLPKVEGIEHFIRGYFDCKGNFGIENNRINSRISGGESRLLNQIVDELHNKYELKRVVVNYRERYISNNGQNAGNFHYLRYGRDESNKLYKALYNNATIWNIKKRNIYDRHMEDNGRQR